MPVFSKMASSYPFQLIRGLGPSVAAGATVGALRNRNNRVGGAVSGAAIGAAGYGAYHAIGAAGYGAYRGFGTMGGFAGLGRMADKVPGYWRHRGMIGNILKNKGEAGLAGMMRRVASAIPR